MIVRSDEWRDVSNVTVVWKYLRKRFSNACKVVTINSFKSHKALMPDDNLCWIFDMMQCATWLCEATIWDTCMNFGGVFASENGRQK